MQTKSHLFRSHGKGAVAVTLLTLAIAPSAHASDCTSELNPVYVTGSSAVKPFLAKVASQLLNSTTHPITVVYLSQGSCLGVAAMAGATAGKMTGQGSLFGPGGVDGGKCDLDLAGTTVDIGASDVYASTCAKTLGAGVVDVHGPNQIMTFAVPVKSTATSISAEAAYLVYGFGAASNGVGPWTDPSVIYQRSSSSGTQGMLATAINVPAAKWLPAANTSASSDLVLAALTTAAGNGKASAAIGILATDYVDLHRGEVRALAYQHYGQDCGYLPDSKATTFDKANVRDGHYMIWGPLHLFAYTGTDGKAKKKDAQEVLDRLSLAAAVADADAKEIIQAEGAAGVVPDCAMHVSRTEEVGPLASFQPAKGCECAFLKATPNAPDYCTACKADSDCKTAGRTHCNYGYCEVK